jgi:hypothetical protein
MSGQLIGQSTKSRQFTYQRGIHGLEEGTPENGVIANQAWASDGAKWCAVRAN